VVAGDKCVRPKLVDRLLLGGSSRLSPAQAHPHWADPPDDKPVKASGVVGSRVWALSDGSMTVLQVWEGIPSPMNDGAPPTVTATDTDVVFLAVADPLFIDARGLTTQLDGIRQTVDWIKTQRAASSLPDASFRVVYCSRTKLEPEPSAETASRVVSTRADDAVVILPSSVAVVPPRIVPKPVIDLASSLGAPLHAVWLDGLQGVGGLARATLAFHTATQRHSSAPVAARSSASRRDGSAGKAPEPEIVPTN
jgi:hypothetical protein